jgi:Tol biopolymer transport system component
MLFAFGNSSCDRVVAAYACQMRLAIFWLVCAIAVQVHAAGPEVFAPGVISTGDDESHPAFTPDGKTVYFIKNTPDFAFWTICLSRFADGRWSEPEVAPFSGQYRDADPFITADGSQLFFISSRPVDGRPKRDLDIWVIDLQPIGGRGEPHRVPGDVNSDANEWFPTMAGDGTLYFGSERTGGEGGVDIWMARRVEGSYPIAQNLGKAINSEANEYEAYVTPDQTMMIVAAEGRKDGGAFDLYVSTRTQDQWSPLRNAGTSINTPWWEFAPKLSPDGKSFYFASNRRAQRGLPTKRLGYSELLQQLHSPGNGLRDIYVIDATALVP